MTTLAAFAVGVAVGLFLPAPYDGIARAAYTKIWSTLKALGGESK